VTEERGENAVFGGEEEERRELGESDEAGAIGVGEQLGVGGDAEDQNHEVGCDNNDWICNNICSVYAWTRMRR
jgi:hypothetical protein